MDQQIESTSLLHGWLKRQVPASGLGWLTQQLSAAGPEQTDPAFLLMVANVPRELGTQALDLSREDARIAAEAVPGWNPGGLSVDQAARLLLMLQSSPTDLVRRLDLFFRTGDLRERVTFYRGLCLYPNPERYATFAMEGIRSSMTALFNAVALDNPYPSMHLTESTWNHMIVKALFVDSPLERISGLDRRANPVLSEMLCDYASERWVGNRTVAPQLWRCVGRFAHGRALAMLKKVFATGNSTERYAAALALWQSGAPEVPELLAPMPQIREMLVSKQLDWDTLPSLTGTASTVH